MYNLTKDTVLAIIDNPLEAIQSLLFLVFLGFFTWGMLWVGAIVTGIYV